MPGPIFLKFREANRGKIKENQRNIDEKTRTAKENSIRKIEIQSRISYQRMLLSCMEKISDFWSDFWDRYFFRWTFRGFLEVVGIELWRILGRVVESFWYSFGRFSVDFSRILRVFFEIVFFGSYYSSTQYSILNLNRP